MILILLITLTCLQRFTMKTNQQELADILEYYAENIYEFAEANPQLAPAIFSNAEKINDPETDRLDESFAFMMAQSNLNFSKALKHYTLHDISTALPEWFEPSVSATIVKANIHDWETKQFYKFPTETQFSYYEKKVNNKEIAYSNELPIEIEPLQVVESYFSYSDNSYSLNFTLKCLVNDYHLGKVNLFIDYRKFNSLYKLLDDLFYSNSLISIETNHSQFHLTRSNIHYTFNEIFNLSLYRESNLTYFLYQFINNLNIFTFFTLNFKNLNILLNENQEVKIKIPVQIQTPDLHTNTNFLHTNCFYLKNKNIVKGDPFYLRKGQTPYLTIDRGSKKNFINIHHIQFYDLEHNDILLEKNKDYKIYKKFIVTKNGLDIIYYLKIITAIDKDIIILPHFIYSDLTDAHYLKNGSIIKLKRNNKYTFENITVPTKTVFYTEYFNSLKFYELVFQMNSFLKKEEISLKDIFSVLNFFSSISINYKGITAKIISQIKVLEETNTKKHFHTPYGTYFQKRYFGLINVNKQNNSFGGISLLLQYLEFLLNRSSKCNSEYTISIKD